MKISSRVSDNTDLTVVTFCITTVVPFERWQNTQSASYYCAADIKSYILFDSETHSWSVLSLFSESQSRSEWIDIPYMWSTCDSDPHELDSEMTEYCMFLARQCHPYSGLNLAAFVTPWIYYTPRWIGPRIAHPFWCVKNRLIWIEKDSTDFGPKRELICLAAKSNTKCPITVTDTH